MWSFGGYLVPEATVLVTPGLKLACTAAWGAFRLKRRFRNPPKELKKLKWVSTFMLFVQQAA